MSTPPRSARRSCSCIVTTRRIRVRCAYRSSCRLRPTNSSSAGLRSITFRKPLRGTVEEKPLAMCDVTSSTNEDFLTMKLRYRDRDGEIFVLRHSPRHHWWYFPHMTKDQAILLKTYDSETDGRARFIGHNAFDDPDTPRCGRASRSGPSRSFNRGNGPRRVLA